MSTTSCTVRKIENLKLDFVWGVTCLGWGSWGNNIVSVQCTLVPVEAVYSTHHTPVRWPPSSSSALALLPYCTGTVHMYSALVTVQYTPVRWLPSSSSALALLPYCTGTVHMYLSRSPTLPVTRTDVTQPI